jgi:hypothetical protein
VGHFSGRIYPQSGHFLKLKLKFASQFKVKKLPNLVDYFLDKFTLKTTRLISKLKLKFESAQHEY